ncbi:MAG: SGNH/GDSL hydrolase family protein [Methanobrevibacter sp.]|nr:SGNH/GDSL hydrolase family protein [Methanobrevibacter sp.]
MIQINKIKEPFIYYCQKVIPLAFDESLSYYEVLCHLTAKIKEVIDEQNIEGQAIEELQEKYLLLVDYVEHYFDNLDVQEEINNKLDDMAEHGELADIIAQYLGLAGVLAFDTVANMVAGENLVNGSICYCLGQETYNDGLGSFYKIRTITSDDTVDGKNIIALNVSNTLIAEKIFNLDLETLKSEMSLINNKKYLFISDSYETGYQGSGQPTIEGFITKTKNQLNLNATIIAENGYGFLGMESNHKWKTLVENTTIENKNLYTDIFILGGMNDRGTDEQIENAMSELFTYLKNNFPNAIIHVGCVGKYAKSNETNLNNMRKITKLYKTYTTLHGNKYIDNSELLLHNMSWFISDNIHPNQKGETQLSYGLMQYILNNKIENFMSIENNLDYQTDTLTPASNVSFTGLAIYSYMTQDNVNLYFNAQINFSENITLNNLTDVTIGNLSDSYVCASTNNQGLDEIIEGYVYSVNEINGSHFVKVLFRFYNDYNNDLHLKAFTVLDNGGVLNLTINQIAFPYGTIKSNINPHYC